MLLFAGQSADLPLPRDFDEQLRARGYVERTMPVQSETLQPSAIDQKRGWMIYRRDRNFEVFPNSRPEPGEQLERLTLTGTAGELESEPFSIYALRDISGIAAEGAVATDTGWLRAAVRVEDVLFQPIQYPTASTRDVMRLVEAKARHSLDILHLSDHRGRTESRPNRRVCIGSLRSFRLMPVPACITDRFGSRTVQGTAWKFRSRCASCHSGLRQRN